MIIFIFSPSFTEIYITLCNKHFTFQSWTLRVR